MKERDRFLQTYPFSHYFYIDFSIFRLFLTRLIHIRNDELVALTMDIDNLNLRIFLQMLAEFGDIHIHRARIEVVVVNPDGLNAKSR